MVDLIGSSAAAKQAGITYRQLHYWVAKGAVVPDVLGIGSGSRTYWTARQVDHLRVMGQVREHFGILMTLDTAGGIMAERLRRLWDALEAGRPWGFGVFVHADGTLDVVSPNSPTLTALDFTSKAATDG